MFFTFNLSLFLGSFCLKDVDIQRDLHKILYYISIFLELNSFYVKKKFFLNINISGIIIDEESI